VLITGLVANSTLDMCPSRIQVGTSCIFNLFILLVMLRGNLWCDSSLLKLIHHIAMVILRRLHLSLLLQLVYFKFKLHDFSLQVIILFTNIFITRFYKHLLNIGMLALSTKSINIKIITSFTSFPYRGFGSFGIT
jgi:hypothetical protein